MQEMRGKAEIMRKNIRLFFKLKNKNYPQGGTKKSHSPEIQLFSDLEMVDESNIEKKIEKKIRTRNISDKSIDILPLREKTIENV